MKCSCCSRIWWDGKPGDEPARYLWTIRTGYEFPLCVKCCAIWRDNARGDDEMTPVRITDYEPTR